MKDDPPSDPPPPASVSWIRIRETLVIVLGRRRNGGGRPPSRLARFLRHEKLGLLWVIGLTLGIQLLEYHGWLAGIEGRVLDWFLRNTSRSHLANLESPIVTVEIDDESYRTCFRETSPLDAKVIVQMVRMLAKGDARGPTILGIDILTDSEREDQLAWYGQLSQDLKDDPGEHEQKIIWASSGEDPTVEGASFGAWLMGHSDVVVVRPTRVLGIEPAALDAAHILWGLPVFPRDEDLRLRRYPRHVEVSSDPRHSTTHAAGPSWARTIAEDYCETTHRCRVKEGAEEVFVSSGVRVGRSFTANKLFACSPDNAAPSAIRVEKGAEWSTLADMFRNPMIVLFGGSFSNARDVYETPDGRVPGLRINAYAIQAELDGATISEAWRPLTVLGDLGLGAFVVYVFWKQTKVRRMMELSVASVLGAFLLSLATFKIGQVWLSCIGVAVGVVLHMILEVYRMDLRKPGHGH